MKVTGQKLTLLHRLVFPAVSCICLVSLGNTPQNRTEALGLGREVFLPVLALVSGATPEQVPAYPPQVREEFSAAVWRAPKKMGLLQWLSVGPDYELRTHFFHPSEGIFESKMLLSNRNKLHRLVRRILENSIADPDYAHWKIRYTDIGSDALREAKVRRWILEFSDARKGAKSLVGVSAEVEVDDYEGKTVIFSVPVTQALLENREIATDRSLEQWKTMAYWQSKRTGNLDRLPASVVVKTWSSVYSRCARAERKPGGAVLQLSSDLLDELVAMEKQTYDWCPLNREQLDRLSLDESVKFLVGRADIGSVKARQVVGYLIYREHADHLEILSTGARVAFKDLGVSAQLLEHLLTKLDSEKTFLLARLPVFQRSLLGSAGFRFWPTNLPVRQDWHDIHRGNAVLSSSAARTGLFAHELSGFVIDGRPQRTFYAGELPAPASVGSPYTPAEHEKVDESGPLVSNAPSSVPDQGEIRWVLPFDGSLAASIRSGMGWLDTLNTPPPKIGSEIPHTIPNVILFKNGALIDGTLKANRPIEDFHSPSPPDYTWHETVGENREEGWKLHLRSEALIRSLWTLDHLVRNEPVQIKPNRIYLLPPEASPPKAPLYLRAWILYDENTVETRKLYVVLVSSDPNWHLKVIDPIYLEPTPSNRRPSDAAEKATPAVESLLQAPVRCNEVIAGIKQISAGHKSN